jgi:hypothetical protein
MRSVFPRVVLVVSLVACGGSSLTLAGYADEADLLVTRVDSRLDAEAAEFFSQAPTVEGTRLYLASRVAGYTEFVAGFRDLDPPEEAEDVHEAFLEILRDLLAAEEARAQRAASLQTVDEIDQIWTGTENETVRALEQKAIELCTAAQSQFDATQERQVFTDNYWVPPELKDVVQVALDCPPPG